MLATDDAATANRRAQLRRWIDERFGGSQTLFIGSTNDGEKQMNQGELSALLKTKSFGERRARSLEKQAGMPAGYLEQTAPGNELPTDIVTPHHIEKAPTGWPFSHISLTRIVSLKRKLGVHKGKDAMQDIEEMLESAVVKWERRLEQSQPLDKHSQRSA